MIDVFYLRTSQFDFKGAAKDATLDLLSATERARYDRFAFDKNRREYLTTRFLVRNVLARYTKRAPHELTFTPNDHGRPVLDHGGNLRFNVTNTLDLVVIAVRRDEREIGIDAEPLERGPDVLSLASAVFRPAERDALDKITNAAERERRAVELWTLKEAYMKARGMGMSIPPNSFEVHARVLAFPSPTIADDPQRWHFHTLELEEHLVSLCIEGERREVRVTPFAT